MFDNDEYYSDPEAGPDYGGSVTYSDEEHNEMDGYGIEAVTSAADVDEEAKGTNNIDELETLSRRTPRDGNLEFVHSSELRADEFCERIKQFQSENVILLVGPDKVRFDIPKTLLTKSSPFFDAAFNGPFLEGHKKSMHLEEDNVLSVQMMLQWIYQGKIKLPEELDATCGAATFGAAVKAYLDFFTLADKIGLCGPLDQIVDNFREMLRLGKRLIELHRICTCSWSEDPEVGMGWDDGPDSHQMSCPWNTHHPKDSLPANLITSEHIKAAFDLRSGHGVRALFADVCVISYLSSLKHAFRFKFTEELTTVNGFGLAIVEHAGIALRSLECNGLSNTANYNGWGSPQVAHDHKIWTTLDPFTRARFQY